MAYVSFGPRDENGHLTKQSLHTGTQVLANILTSWSSDNYSWRLFTYDGRDFGIPGVQLEFANVSSIFLYWGTGGLTLGGLQLFDPEESAYDFRDI